MLRILSKALTTHKTYTSALLADPSKIEEITTKVTVGGVEKTFTYSNNKSFATDIKFIISLFAARGCNWERIKQKSIDEVATVMEFLKEKLDLDVEKRTPGAALSPDMVTVARLAACFPLITCNVYASGHSKILVSSEQIGLPEEIAKQILCPFFTGLIPKTFVKADQGVIILFFLIHVLIDNLIHKKEKECRH